MRLTRYVLVVGLLAASGCLHLPQDMAERAGESESRIRGTWVAAETADAHGGPPSGRRLVVTESRFDIVSPAGVVVAPGTYSADFRRFPHPIDIIATVHSGDGKPGLVHQEIVFGIVKVDGDALTLCLDASTGPKVRPRRFAADGERVFEDRGRTFVQAVFRRETPATAREPVAPPSVSAPILLIGGAALLPKPVVPNDGWKPRRSGGVYVPKQQPSIQDMPPLVDGREVLSTMPTPE